MGESNIVGHTNCERSSLQSMEKHLPANYNPEDYPAVRMRNKRDSGELSETQRKRRSKNMLSARRSTGVSYSAEVLEDALAMGPDGNYGKGANK